MTAPYKAPTKPILGKAETLPLQVPDLPLVSQRCWCGYSWFRSPCKPGTVDGKKSCDHQLIWEIYGKYSMIYGVSYRSQVVVWDFFHRITRDFREKCCRNSCHLRFDYDDWKSRNMNDFIICLLKIGRISRIIFRCEVLVFRGPVHLKIEMNRTCKPSLLGGELLV